MGRHYARRSYPESDALFIPAHICAPVRNNHIEKDTLTHAQITNIQDIRLPALTDEPTLFMAFVTGLKYYHATQHDRAINGGLSTVISESGRSTSYIDNVPIFFSAKCLSLQKEV
jgi:hypothetical protein